MKKRRIQYLILVVTGVLQFLFYQQRPLESYEYTFLMGSVMTYDNVDLLQMAAFPVPIIFLLFAISGKYQEETRGYGFLLLVRNYSKTRYLLESDGKMGILMIFQVIFLYALYSCNVVGLWEYEMVHVAFSAVLRAIPMYGLVCLVLILLQLILEMYVDPLFVTGILTLYVVSSVLFYPFMKQAWLLKLFVPALSVGAGNGAVSGGSKYAENILYCVCAVVVLLTIQIKIFKKRSII